MSYLCRNSILSAVSYYNFSKISCVAVSYPYLYLCLCILGFWGQSGLECFVALRKGRVGALFETCGELE